MTDCSYKINNALNSIELECVWSRRSIMRTKKAMDSLKSVIFHKLIVTARVHDYGIGEILASADQTALEAWQAVRELRTDQPHAE